MTRGFVYKTYLADDGTSYQTRVDADHAADATRGWGAVIPGGPHSVNVTHPRQFNRALLDFLAA